MHTWTLQTADLLALLAAFCWSLANVTIARGSRDHKGDNGAFLSILFTVAMAGVVWLAAPPSGARPPMGIVGLAWFALGGMLTIFIGRVFVHASIEWLGAMRGASIKRLAPVFSVVLGITILDEPLSRSLLAGMALIFIGFGLLAYESAKAAKKSAASAPGAASDMTHAQPGRGGRVAKWINPGVLYGAVSALAYACGNIARKFGLNEIPDPAFGVLFGAFVGMLLFVGMAAAGAGSYRTAVRSTFTRFNPWLMAAGVVASAGQLFFFAAIDHGTISRATLVVSAEVFITMGLMALVFRQAEKMSGAAIAAAALGVAGTWLIVAADDAQPVASSRPVAASQACGNDSRACDVQRP